MSTRTIATDAAGLGKPRAAAFVSPALLIIAVFLVFPALFTLYLGTTNYKLTGIEALHPQFVGLDNYRNALTDRWFTDAFAAQNPDVIERRKQQVMATPAEIFLNVFDIYAESEMSPWLHEVTAPSLVLTGELDGGCNPRLNKQIAAALPKSELVILDGLKHAIMIEASDRVAPPVRQFLLANS